MVMLEVKNPLPMKEMHVLIPELGRYLGVGSSNHSVFLPGEFHGQKNLVGYSSWGHKESDTT